jgi:DNA repair exonuclease SbcCD nuclease subunit
MRKILYFSDLHLDARTCAVRRFGEGIDVLHQVVKIAQDNQVEAVVFGGDLCNGGEIDSIRCVVALQATARALLNSGIEFFAVAGNHDIIEDGYGTTVLSVLDKGVVETPAVVGMMGRAVLFLPHPSSARPYNPEEAIKGAGAADIIIGHLSIAGATPGSESRELNRGRQHYWPLEAIKKKFPNALLLGGHYHEGKVYSGVNVVGGAMRFTFGEEHHQPRVAIVDFETLQIEYIPLERSAKLVTIPLGAPRSAYEGASYVRLIAGADYPQAQIEQYKNQLILEVLGVKVEKHDISAAPGAPESAPLDSVDDGIEVARQLARDFATADNELKEAIGKLVEVVNNEARS